MKANDDVVSLVFPLDAGGDWPPVTAESLPFRKVGSFYENLMAPLFIKDLSVGDVLAAEVCEGRVASWRHVSRSNNSTIWLLRLRAESGIEGVVPALNALGCHFVDFGEFGCHSIGVPKDASLARVDEILSVLDSDAVGVAYPSIRHSA